MLLRCPKCRSSRVRQGYSKPHLLLRLIGYNDLLCDGCNLNYRAFTIPGTVPESSRSRKRRHRQETNNVLGDDAGSSEMPPSRHSSSSSPERKKDHAANPLGFLSYYLKLRLDVLLGRHKTPRPLDINWRWRHWKRRKKQG